MTGVGAGGAGAEATGGATAAQPVAAVSSACLAAADNRFWPGAASKDSGAVFGSACASAAPELPAGRSSTGGLGVTAAEPPAEASFAAAQPVRAHGAAVTQAVMPRLGGKTTPCDWLLESSVRLTFVTVSLR